MTKYRKKPVVVETAKLINRLRPSLTSDEYQDLSSLLHIAISAEDYRATEFAPDKRKEAFHRLVDNLEIFFEQTYERVEE